MKTKRSRVVRIAISFVLAIALFHLGIATAAEPEVVVEKMVITVEGSEAVVPAAGTPGCGDQYNYRPYNLPGEHVDETIVPCNLVNLPYNVAYDPGCAKPVQSTDWWSGVGLQWKSWVAGYNASNPVVVTKSFYNEPFLFQFVDLPDLCADQKACKTVEGLDLPVQGLRMWNQYEIYLHTDPSPENRWITRGDIATQESPVVTVGLAGVHPIHSGTGAAAPTSPPWTNVKIKSYTNWGVVMGYKHKGGDDELEITMANGSPFVWFERKGTGMAPFRVWVGASPYGLEGDNFTLWYNEGHTIGLTVSAHFNPKAIEGETIDPQLTTSSYVIYSDAGTWTEQKATNPDTHMSLFKNEDATKVVALAMPHNIAADKDARTAALKDLEKYAWNKITDTRIHYPPIKGSKTSNPASGKPLGYDEKKSVVRTLMEVTTEDFKTGGAGDTALQIVFPHHRKAMITEDLNYILKGDDQKAKYTWRSILGELQAYEGNAYAQELKTYGLLPFLPGVAVNYASEVNGKIPAEDIYKTMKEWFFNGEPATTKINPVCRDQSAYLGDTVNTYIYATAALFESMVIADQLAQSAQLTATDTDLKKSKNAVAAEMRDFILQSLKELIGQWADVYTSQWFQYNPEFNTVYGYPSGYGSVQDLNDKHFHWGYFLRSAAAIGRYDKQWLQNYMPLFEKLVADVASFDRGTVYPFLRNFSPFYGHSWANGLSNGSQGADQESTSEAVNFAVGMIELGQALDKKDWRNIGMYLYEGEILGAEQYWFNQDADLKNSTGPDEYYNGNWPDSYVHQDDNSINLITGQLFQEYLGRTTFFGGSAYYTNYIIQAVPLSAFTLYVGRNQEWLKKAWEEFDLEAAKHNNTGTSYEVLLAGLQARLPEGAAGTGINASGLTGALARINKEHQWYQASTNTMGKHWAYTNHLLGQVDIKVTADTASYGVFKSDETRTYVAYNPGADTLRSVGFSDGAALTDIPAYSMAYKTGKNGEQSIDKLSKPAEDKTRLYLRKETSMSASCDALTPQVMNLSADPGTWKLSAGTTPFPKNYSALNGSIVCVPVRPYVDPRPADPSFPDEKYVRTWKGTFSGKRVTTDAKDAFTRFAIYGNQVLFPGWQLEPEANISQYEIHIMYDFDGDGETDRWEKYQTGTDAANTFVYDHKMTEYRFNLPWPYNPAPPVKFWKKKAFPNFVAHGKGTITVKLCGAWDSDKQTKSLPTPISVNADPLTNRASWVQPPYSPHSHR